MSPRRGRMVLAIAVAAALAAASLVFPGLPTERASAAVTLPSGFVLQDLATGMTPPSSAGPGDLLSDSGRVPPG